MLKPIIVGRAGRDVGKNLMAATAARPCAKGIPCDARILVICYKYPKKYDSSA